VSVLGGGGDEVFDSETAEVFGSGVEGFGIDFVDGEEDGFAGAEQETREIDVGRGELGAAVNDHDDGVGFFECGLCLAVDFRRDEGRIVWDDATGVDEAGGAAGPFYFTVDAVAGDAGLVSYDGTAGAREAVEERGFADVGASYDGEGGLAKQTRLRRISSAPCVKLICRGFLQIACQFDARGVLMKAVSILRGKPLVPPRCILYIMHRTQLYLDE
jgi:hypothetical protein